MGRFVLILIAIAIGTTIHNSDLLEIGEFQDKLLLVAALPGVYLVGLALLKG